MVEQKEKNNLVFCRPVVNFINILRVNFLYKSLFSSFFYLQVTREKLPKRRVYEKFARKMLMKLTPGQQLVDFYSTIPLFLCSTFDPHQKNVFGPIKMVLPASENFIVKGSISLQRQKRFGLLIVFLVFESTVLVYLYSYWHKWVKYALKSIVESIL